MKFNQYSQEGKCIPFRDLEHLERDQLVKILEDAVRQADVLVHERDHALVLLAEHQRAALQSTAAQVHLTEQLAQRDTVIRDQQKQLHDLQQRVRGMEEEVMASQAATLQHRAEVNNAVEELQITAEELETANHALHMANERFVMVLSCAQAGTWDWDMTDNRAVWSPEYFELHGLRPEVQEPSYQTWYDAVHPADRPRVERTIRDWLERRENEIDLEYRILHPDKGLRWLVLSWTLHVF